MIEDLIQQSFLLLQNYGVSTSWFGTDAGEELLESARIVASDQKDSFQTPYEVAVYLLEGMTSVLKEQALEEGAAFHATQDGRLITSVIASQDGLQEEALQLIQSARGADVLEIYHQVLQPLNLHCPTCSCETDITGYDAVFDLREQFLLKLQSVLGTDK